MPSRISPLAIAATLAILAGGAARAATLTVTDLGDSGGSGQLRTLMNAAAAGDVIVVPAGKITLTGASGDDQNASGDLDVLKNLTIQGAGAGATIIDANFVDRVFDVIAPSVATISGMTVQNGVATQGGGGGIRNAGTLILSSVVVTSHRADKPQGGSPNPGGGILNSGTLTATGLVVQLSTAVDEGGGMENEAGAAMTLSDSTVRSNFANKDGGGIRNLGTITLTGVTLDANNTDHGGGGIATAGTATLTNATLYLNNASASGGGISNAGTLGLLNVTVSANTTPTSGAAGGLANTGTASVKNVLFGGNVAGPPTARVEAACSGTITSLGGNLDSGTTCALSGAGDLGGTNPRLGAFQNNGGPTDTLALLPGSPAIDAGASAGCPATDQRGVARPQGSSCDIGAYEATAIALAIAPATLPDPTEGAAYAQALSVVVTNGVTYTPPTPSFTLTAGALPAGLTLATTGAVTGTPTAAGPSTFSVTATDANGLTASRAYALTVAAATASPVLDVAPGVLPGATAGAAYAQTLTVVVTNGVTYTPPAPSFAVTAGALPVGLSLSAGGDVAGTPGAAGPSTFTVTATDANGRTASRPYTLVVAPADPAGTPPPASSSGCGCTSGSADSLALLLAALVAWRAGRRSRRRTRPVTSALR